MTDKEKYRLLCEKIDSIPIFSQAWWLDSVAGTDGWNVVLYEKEDEIIGTLPYVLMKKSFLNYIGMPLLTQFLGIWIKEQNFQNQNSKLSLEKEIYSMIIEKIPDVSFFNQSFHYNVTNWLPFYWKGFVQTTRYTYVIKSIENPDLVYNKFDRSKKKDIRKAEKILTVGFDMTAQEFYENHKLTLAKQGQKISYSFSLFETIYNAAYERKQGRIIWSKDNQDNLHSALFVIWDQGSAYNLISTIDPDYRISGSASLLVYKIIDYLSNKTKSFDFEGSMIENVERSFRKFGTEQIPYFNITKNNSKLLMLREFLLKVKNK